MLESARSLKAKARFLANKTNVTVQEIIQSYMFERILIRISRSNYCDNFILKGGLLVSSLSGIQSRTTMDMDTMLRGLDLSKEKLMVVIEEILSIDANDGITFEIADVEDIREEDVYSGLRFKIIGLLENIKNTLSIDVSTGDIITPREVSYLYKKIFEDDFIKIKSYNLETVLAEKFQTVLERNGAKGRMKDYYDIWYFVNFRWDTLDFQILNRALLNTFVQRVSLDDLSKAKVIVNHISNSLILRKRWNEYSSKHSYTSSVSFESVIEALLEFSKVIRIIANNE